MSTEIIGSELRIKVDGAIASLTALGNAGDAAGKKVAREAIKALKEMTAAAASAEAATKKAATATTGMTKSATGATGANGNLSNSLMNLSFQMNDVATMAAMGADPMRILASQTGQFVQVAQQAGGATALLKGALAAITPVMGFAAVAALAVGGAYFYLAGEAEKANKKVEASALAATKAQEAHAKLAKLQLSTADAAALAMGTMSMSDIKLRDSIQGVTAEYGPRINAVKGAITTQQALIDKNAAFIASGKGVGSAIQLASDAQQKATKESARLRAELGGLEAQQGALIQQTVIGVKYSKDDADAKGEQADAAAKARAASEKAAAQAAKAAEAEADQIRANLKVREEARQQEIAFADISARSEMAAIFAVMDAEKLAAKETAKAREEAAKEEKEQQKELTEIRNAAFQALQNIAQAFSAATTASLSTHMESLDAVQARLEDIRDGLKGLGTEGVEAANLTSEALTNAYLAGEVGVEDLTAVQQEALEKDLLAREAAAVKKEKIEKAAAKKAFELNQAASIAAAAVAGLVGMVSAFQLGPIAGAIASVGIAALTATNIGLIAAEKPKFHAGGVGAAAVMYPDERNTTTLPGEGHLNRQAVNRIGVQGVNAINAGATPGAGAPTFRIGRLEVREILRTGKSELTQTIKTISRRSSFGAGLSGRGAKA